MKRQHLSAGLSVLTLFASIACSPDSGVERQQTGSGGSGASGGAGTGGAGSGGIGTGGGGTSGGSSGGGGVASGAGGVAGSAGSAAGGSAGSSAGSAGTGGTAGSPGVGCTGSELFCEDFEDTAVDAVPGSPWLPLAEYCATSGEFSTGVTSELFHGSGSKSFKATNDRPPNCRLSAPFPDTDDFWLRTFIYWEPEVSFTNKEILAIDLHPESGINTDDPAIRFGSRSKEPCTASAGPQITLIGFAGGERTGCNGTIQEPKGDWYCFEAHVTQSTNITVKTYVDGAEFSYQSSGKDPTETIGTDSAPAAKVNHVRIGFFTHDGSGTGSVYLDDLAIATTRLGCGP
jgi:hypothetical protein